MKNIGIMVAFGMATLALAAQPAKSLGTGREVMWDMDRIAALDGGAKLTLHHPQQREISLVHDAPWEGNACGYYTILHDDVNYKMYYRGCTYKMKGRKTHEVTCYAESDDGIHWRKPNLGLCKWEGSTDNNIIFLPSSQHMEHNFTPFLDRNPNCPKEEKYKGFGGIRSSKLFGFTSPDGIHWKSISDKPLITEGAFDSQNIAFWDVRRGCYVTYYRTFWKDANGVERRGVQMATSPDFRKWSAPQWLAYTKDSPVDELYTNATVPYDRAPEMYVSFPMRFTAGRYSVHDKAKGGGTPGTTDSVFMSSRDGLLFKRWGDAFLRPGLQHERWLTRNNAIAWGYVYTKSGIAGCPDEISLYSTENYFNMEEGNRLRRMTIRVDGFVSVNAPYSGGGVTTKPLTFAAAGGEQTRLLLNASTSSAGFIRCEIRDEAGRPYPGFALSDSEDVFGDEIELPMAWKSGASVSALAGKVVVLHFDMKDADIYSYRFGK